MPQDETINDDARIKRVADRLLDAPEPVDGATTLQPDWAPLKPFDRPPVAAAVLIALVRRERSYSMLFTQRSSDLRAHSGQVSFPGGKIDAGDADAAAAAIREASEEVALAPENASVLGYMPTYFTGTNYLITPVVAVVEQSAPFAPNPEEVESVFEVPLSLISTPNSYGTFRISRGDREHRTWQLDHQGHVIWGITANLTRQFRDIALLEDDDW